MKPIEDQSDPLLTQITPYTVAFLCPRQDSDGLPGWIPSGSGVFVSIGRVRGIATAAHVIKEIQKYPECALLIFNEKESPAPHMKFKPVKDEMIMLGSGEGRDGPDLGYLRIPHELEGWLDSKAVFYNFDVRLNRAEEPALPLIYEVAAGVISERTVNKVNTDEKRVDVHTLTRAYGSSLNARRPIEEFDLFDFVLQHNDEVPVPEKSYGGLSGGAVWLVADEPGANNLLLKGIVYYEDWSDELNALFLICNGPESIYRRLADAVGAKFNGLAG